MLIPYDQYDRAYQQIKEDALRGNCSVLVFVAPDVDAICASRIFATLLKSDFVSFRLVPVSGYDDLAAANEQLIQGNTEIRTIVMLNCGGLVDMEEFFSLSDDMVVYVIDSHRPLNLHNLFSNDQVLVFEDQEGQQSLEPIRLAFTEEDSENEHEDSDQENAGNGRKPKRRANDEVEMAKKQRRKENRRKIAEYYSSSWFGASVAHILYSLATQLTKDTNELLWLAIIGLTDLYISERIQRDRYMTDVLRFRDDVLRNNIDVGSQSESSRIDKAYTDRRIRFEEELMLLRHWTLYESMYHSSYVATRLGIWKEKGRKKLQHFLASMGFPLRECQQKFALMDPATKSALREKLEKFSPQYGLSDLYYGSFNMQHGYRIQLSASDVVYAVCALLESSPETALKLGAQVNWTDVAAQAQTSSSQLWLKNFYTAYDALDSQNLELLQKGLELAMRLQVAVVRQGTSLIEKRSVITTKTLRFVILVDSPDQGIFVYPLTLRKLGLFLVEALKESSKSTPLTSTLPFVIAALNPQTNLYLVVGLTGNPRFGDLKRNNFGLAFRKAAEKTRAQAKHDSFETSVIEIKKDDLTKFMESLQLSFAGF